MSFSRTNNLLVLSFTHPTGWLLEDNLFLKGQLVVLCFSHSTSEKILNFGLYINIRYRIDAENRLTNYLVIKDVIEPKKIFD